VEVLSSGHSIGFLFLGGGGRGWRWGDKEHGGEGRWVLLQALWLGLILVSITV
jgi:hypothetical protein